MVSFKRVTFTHPDNNDITPRGGYLLNDENTATEPIVYTDDNREVKFTDIHEIDGDIIAGSIEIE